MNADVDTINTTALEITWRDVLMLMSRAYYQGLMVEMTKGTDAEVIAPTFTFAQLAQMRQFLGANATDIGDEFMIARLGLAVNDWNNTVDELAARRH